MIILDIDLDFLNNKKGGKMTNYPNNIDLLEQEINFEISLIKYSNSKKRLLINYINWLNKNKDKIIMKVNKKQYLQYQAEADNKFALQVWNKGKKFDILEYNVMSNYINNENNEKTLVIK